MWKYTILSIFKRKHNFICDLPPQKDILQEVKIKNISWFPGHFQALCMCVNMEAGEPSNSTKS